MTIKTLINQKQNKEDNQDNQNQNLSVSNARNNHRNVLNQLGAQENQSPQREKRSITAAHVYDESTVRHRRVSIKSKSKRDHLFKRERDREKLNKNQLLQIVVSKSSPAQNQSASHSNIGCQSTINNSNNSSTIGNVANVDEKFSGYNSGDEHIGQRDAMLTPEEWNKRDATFVTAISERGLVIKEIIEDGACLFRAISLQIYGDQEMHEVIRQQTMDYIIQNREYFAQFVTEDISNYVLRKRQNNEHGNHIEIQAMSEMYNRPVELYCYEMEPINIFNSEQINNGYEPLRLSYQRCSHYNAILNPCKASVGVGLGLAGYLPEQNEHKQFKDAVQLSEEQEIEQTMFEDKLKTTDWEATNEAIEEQIARESYLQWCRENLKADESNYRSSSTTSSSTVTSTSVSTTKPSSNHTSSSHITTSHSNELSLSNNDERNNTIDLDNDVIANINDDNNDIIDLNQETTSSSSTINRDNYRRTFRQYLGSSSHILTKRRRLRPSILNNNKSNNDSLKLQSSIPLKKRKLNRNTYELTSSTGTSSNKIAVNNDTFDNSGLNSLDTSSHGTPSTSKSQIIESNEPPISIFYQSLLESSYTDDGVGQLSEQEMIQKALQLSRIDFLKIKEKHSTSLIDEEYDSSP